MKQMVRHRLWAGCSSLESRKDLECTLKTYPGSPQPHSPTWSAMYSSTHAPEARVRDRRVTHSEAMSSRGLPRSDGALAPVDT